MKPINLSGRILTVLCAASCMASLVEAAATAGVSQFGASSWLAHCELKHLRPGETQIADVVWTNATDRALTLRQLHPTSDHLEVIEAPGTVEAGAAGQLRVRIEPPASGRWNAAIFADPEGQEGERFLFTFSGLVGGTEGTHAPVEVGNEEPGVWISAADLHSRLAGSAGPILVDVRPAVEFQGGAIPGSLNLSPFELKARASLKNRPLLLISRGHDEAGLLQERTRLLRGGFRDIQILRGGINAWARQGYELTGRGDRRRVLEVSAREVVAMRPLTGWVLEGGGAGSAFRDFLKGGPLETPPRAALASPGDTKPLRVLQLASRDRTEPEVEGSKRGGALVVFQLSAGPEECLRQFLFQVAQSQSRSVTQETFDMSSYIRTFRSSRASGNCCGK